MQPGEAAVRLGVQVAQEDAQAHGGMIVGLVGILLGVLVSGLRGSSVAARTRPLPVDLRQRPRSPSLRLGYEVGETH